MNAGASPDDLTILSVSDAEANADTAALLHSRHMTDVLSERSLSHVHKASLRGGDQIQSIQVMRGVAAIAVAAFHTHVILAQHEYGSMNVFGWLSSKGWLGVNFFFVLSGFIILFAHAKDIGRPDRWGKYLWRRFTRVYPIYWILLTAYITAAALGFGYPDFKWAPGQMLTAYTLLQLVNLPELPLKVAWTLLFEVRFYLVFLTLLLSRRVGVAVVILWGAAVLVRNSYHPLPDWGYLAPDWGMLSIWNINFLFGVLAAWSLRKVHVANAAWMIIGGVCLLSWLSYGIVEMDSNVRKPVLMTFLGLAFALIILGAALLERRHRFKAPRPAKLLGDASYSIYLVHSATISLVAGVNFKFTYALLPPSIVYLVAFTTSVAAGVIVHLLIEKPVLSWIRNFGPKGSRAGAGNLNASASTM